MIKIWDIPPKQNERSLGQFKQKNKIKRRLDNRFSWEETMADEEKAGILLRGPQ